MLRIIWIAVLALASVFRSRRNLVLENLALRQQLAAFKSRGRSPRIRPTDRAFWLVLRRVWSAWRDALVFVKPDTVVRWHRAGFKIYWNWISQRARKPGPWPRPTIPARTEFWRGTGAVRRDGRDAAGCASTRAADPRRRPPPRRARRAPWRRAR